MHLREIADGIADALGKRPFLLRIPGKLALALSRNLSRMPNRRLTGIHQTVKKWMAEDVYDSQSFNRTENKYSPSCLIFGKTKSGRNIHVLLSETPVVVIITVYEPDPTEWINGKIRG